MPTTYINLQEHNAHQQFYFCITKQSSNVEPLTVALFVASNCIIIEVTMRNHSKKETILRTNSKYIHSYQFSIMYVHDKYGCMERGPTSTAALSEHYMTSSDSFVLPLLYDLGLLVVGI